MGLNATGGVCWFHDDPYSFIRASDMLVHPSRRGPSMAVLEVWSSGRQFSPPTLEGSPPPIRTRCLRLDSSWAGGGRQMGMDGLLARSAVESALSRPQAKYWARFSTVMHADGSVR